MLVSKETCLGMEEKYLRDLFQGENTKTSCSRWERCFLSGLVKTGWEKIAERDITKRIKTLIAFSSHVIYTYVDGSNLQERYVNFNQVIAFLCTRPLGQRAI